MDKVIPVIVTMDTKGPEGLFLKDFIERQGFDALVIDVGTRESRFAPDYPYEVVAECAGVTLEELGAMRRDNMMRTMGEGASQILLDFWAAGKLAGVISIGGNQGTSIASFAMEALPVGIPKLIISTVASGNIRPYVGYKDIMMMFSVFDFVGGINSIGKTILSNGAGAVIGMAQHGIPFTADKRKTVGITAFGNTDMAVSLARQLLEKKGYEVIAFHASGAGGSAMEYLVEQGYIQGVLDLTTHELLGEKWGDDIYTPLRPRLTEAVKKGIPLVVCPGAIEYFCFGGPETIPQKYLGRKTHYHNPYNTNVRATAEELKETGEFLISKLNLSKGKTAVCIPLKGFSANGKEGGALYEPETDQVLIDILEEKLEEKIPLVKVRANINDPVFAETAVDFLIKYMEEEKENG
ncbi:Tm-1-like ATP-binding domain-containing protein [Lachnospiraceae bacterium 62-35]